MSESEEARDDAEVAQMAVEALKKAQQEAMASGHPYTLVVNDELVRFTGSERVVLKKMPPRIIVSPGVARLNK